MGVSFLARSISFGGKDARTAALRSISFNGRNSEAAILKSFCSKKMILQGSLSFNGRELDKMLSFKSPSSDMEENVTLRSVSRRSREIHDQLPTADSMSKKNLQRPISGSDNHRHQAALKLQKTYKSFRTRRRLADCAVLVEQRWWKLLDFAELKRSSISFFDVEKPETVVSRWTRATTKAAKVGKGLSKDEKARKLALQHWLEAIDPRHRYGHNLQFYYVKWLHCDSKQPFFYWLDVGEGREVNLDRCPRPKIQQQCIKYLGPVERQDYEVAVLGGKFLYKQSRKLIDTRGGLEGAKWIFVLSTSKILYVGLKKKGTFQHSSFLAGGATLSAGRLVVEDGILKAVWPHSGHYLPTEENFEAFMLFLEEHHVDLSTVQRSPRDGEEEAFTRRASSFVLRNSKSEPDFGRVIKETNAKSSDREITDSRKHYSKDAENLQPQLSRRSRGLSSKITALEIPKMEDMFNVFKKEEQGRPSFSTLPVECSFDGYDTSEECFLDTGFSISKYNLFDEDEEEEYEEPIPKEKIIKRINSHKGMKSYQLAQQLSCKWTTGAGPRIGCMRDYPSELQFRVLEEVSLSPRSSFSSPPKYARCSSTVRTPTNLCRETTVERSSLSSEQVIVSQRTPP